MAASSLSSQDDSIIWYHATNEHSASVPAREALRENLSARPVFATPSRKDKGRANLQEGEIYGANQITAQAKIGGEAVQFLGFCNGTTRLDARTEYPRSTTAVIARGALPIYNYYITDGKDLLPGTWLYVVFVFGMKDKKLGSHWYALGDIDYLPALLREDGFAAGTNVTVHVQPVARVLSRTRGVSLKQFKTQSQAETPASGKDFNTVYALITV